MQLNLHKYIKPPAVMLPRNLDIKSVESVFLSIYKTLKHNIREIIVDFSQLNFATPAGATALAAITTGFSRAGIGIYIAGINPNNPSIQYLSSAGFFDVLEAKENVAQPRNTTIPFLALQNTNHIPFLHSKLKPWLQHEIAVSDDTLETICTCITEALQNVEHHAGGIGFTMAQHYPKINEIQISVSDLGKGIPTQVKKIHPIMNDREALIKSIERGFSSKSNYTNRGFGLDNLIRYTVGKNGGRVTIRSAGAKLTATRNSDGILNIKSTQESISMPGSTVQISLRTDTLEMETNLSPQEFIWQ